MITQSKLTIPKLSAEHFFMLSALIVNFGNYLYNLILGRVLGPALFSDAAVLITFLLVLSFVAMTFQLVTAKFSVMFEAAIFKSFVSKMYRSAIVFGCVLGLLICLFSTELQHFFKTTSSNMFIIFGVGVPVYFIMSINRGVFQGKKEFKSLSLTYQSEMLSRLIITLAIIYFFNIKSPVIIAVGLSLSFMFGLIPTKSGTISFKKVQLLKIDQTKAIRHFFILTAFYELTQIIINNSDILLVKHFFNAHEAGLYAALALIGRLVYFITWMFVMVLLPTVVQLNKEGKETTTILVKYLGYISALAFSIVGICIIYPEIIIKLMFGDMYLSMSNILWKYSLATALFAISNIFAYYFLSLDKYVPVIISGIIGILQVVLILIYHSSINQIINLQILGMLILLVLQILYFVYHKKS